MHSDAAIGAPPFRITGRAAPTVTFESDPAAIRNVLPVKNILSGQYVVTDIALPHGRAVHDYLAPAR